MPVDPATARYLRYIGSQGYELAEVELRACAVKPKSAPAPVVAEPHKVAIVVTGECEYRGRGRPGVETADARGERNGGAGRGVNYFFRSK